MARLKAGLVLNPLAGVGGPAALKGSDGVADEALKRGSVSKVGDRVRSVLTAIDLDKFEWFTVAGDMGGDLLAELDTPCHVVHTPADELTTPADTRAAVSAMAMKHIDLLLFAGGDGTARDVCDACNSIPAVVGIPCGVKMHSGVFTSSPRAAAALLRQLTVGKPLSLIEAEVRDIDEASFRQGIVKTKFHGEMPVPDDLQFMQQTKVGGKEVDELVLQDIAADYLESMDAETLYIMGSGSTVAGLLAAMELPATLLGIDVVQGQQLVASDVTEKQLLALLQDAEAARIVVTAIGAQGHIFGRGNQQLSPSVIRKVGLENIDIVATKSKIASLNGRPMLLDTGDASLDLELAGLRTVITGYEDRVLYRLS